MAQDSGVPLQLWRSVVVLRGINLVDLCVTESLGAGSRGMNHSNSVDLLEEGDPTGENRFDCAIIGSQIREQVLRKQGVFLGRAPGSNPLDLFHQENRDPSGQGRRSSHSLFGRTAR